MGNEFYERWWLTLERPKKVQPPNLDNIKTASPPGVDTSTTTSPIIHPKIVIGVQEDHVSIDVEGALGIGFGSSLGLTSIIGAVCYCIWRKKRRSPNPDPQVGRSHEASEAGRPLGRRPESSQAPVNHRQGCNNALPGQPPVLPKALPQNKRDDTGSGAVILPVTSPSKEDSSQNTNLVSGRSGAKYVHYQDKVENPATGNSNLAKNVEKDAQAVRAYLGKEKVNTQCSDTEKDVQPDNSMRSGILGGLTMLDHVQEETYRSQLANLDEEANLSSVENGTFIPTSMSTPLPKQAETEKDLGDDTVVQKCPEPVKDLPANQEDADFHGYTNEDVAESSKRLDKMRRFFAGLGKVLNQSSPEDSNKTDIPLQEFRRASTRSSRKVFQNLNEKHMKQCQK